EPRTFPLERTAEGRLLEAVTPDFYLPEAGLYIGCTEMKSSLATRKRRKLRKLRTRYAEVVTLVGRSEVARHCARSTVSPGAAGRRRAAARPGRARGRPS